MWRSVSLMAVFIGLLELSLAQRPSYAGLRPPGGLSQKDKYHGTQNTAVENITGLDIATRFGEDAVAQQTQTVSLAYGTAQRPPVGVPLVVAISSQAAAVPASPPAPATVANRFGAADADQFQGNGIFTASSPSGASGATTPTAATLATVATVGTGAPSVLPIDAHGDRDYVNYLSQLPADNQPFWFLNYQAIEALRNSTRPNVGPLETRGSFFAG